MKSSDHRRNAVLLLAFGGPRSLDEIPEFLKLLMGRSPTLEQLAEVRRRYEAIGGRSPLPATTMRQQALLEEALAAKGIPLPISVGMRYTQPLIPDALQELKSEGAETVVLIPLTPYRSPYTSEGLYEEAKQAATSLGLRTIEPPDWQRHPLLCAAWAKKIQEGKKDGDIPILFTAHSLPELVANRYNYQRQLEETIAGILAITGPLPWRLAFQSQRKGEKWLGPCPEEVLQDLFKKGGGQVLVVPIGFITDHLETLYDIDIQLKDWGKVVGIEVIRVPCLNEAPELIALLCDLVERGLEKV